MRIRKKTWARPELEAASFFITNPREYKGKWKETFKNNNDIYLELGCGRATFTAVHAVDNPYINYIAIDIKDEMLVFAKRNVEKYIHEAGREVDNVKILPLEIAFIDEVFDKDEISRIYINFCNPWPKARHNKRRLTHPRLLEKYKNFLKPDSEIWFKTDDRELFEASLEYFKESNFELKYTTFDLHESDFQGNVETEHEKMFTEMGKKTMFLIAKVIK